MSSPKARATAPPAPCGWVRRSGASCKEMIFLSKIVLYPANGCDFDAADVAAYLAGLTSGVFSGDEDFPVTAAGGLKVTVGAGRGWVHPSRFTGYSITKREADTLTMPLADPSLPRIDCIVMRYDAGARAASLQVLQGTASSTPTAPAISRTELIYDLCLAEITRPAGSTSISTGQITDTRLDEALCGIVRDGVTGIPTDELLAAAKERISALEEKATSSAAAAKDSAEAAKSSEAKSAASEKAAKTSETAAKRALQDTETEHTTALQNIAQARTTALNDVAASTKTATAAAETATQQATAAAGSASTAATKAGEASTSAGEASTSRQAAEKAQKAAEDAAALAGTRAGTDKTLSVPDAPADAKTVGDKFKSIKTDWNSVTDKPETFPPSAHNHSKLEFENKNEVNFVGIPENNTVYWGYRDNTIDEYRFNDGRGSGAFANVRANKFIGSLDGNAETSTKTTGITDYNSSSRTIQVGYAGDGLNTSNLTHIAGYTDDGTKIKDVSKDVLKSWLGVTNITSQTSDPGAGSSLATGSILLVYV
nr:MAG TPA: Receptor Binding Protein [Caudoviricetes sp.]